MWSKSKSIESQLKEQMGKYIKIYDPIITKSDSDKPASYSVDVTVPSGITFSESATTSGITMPVGTYTHDTQISPGANKVTATLLPIIVYDQEHKLSLGTEFNTVMNNPHGTPESKITVYDQTGKSIDLFGLNYSVNEAKLHIQKYEFCRQLQNALTGKKSPTPTELKTILDRLLTEQPRALDGVFSKTKQIVTQLIEKAEKDYKNTPREAEALKGLKLILDEHSTMKEVKRSFRR